MPRYGVIADVHGNAEALHAALRVIDRRAIDRLLCAGDLVGFNADGDQVIAELARAEAVCIAGNHDRIAVGQLDTGRCWYQAAHALDRTREALREPSRHFLSGLPTFQSVDGELFLFHGAVDDVQRYSRSSDDLRHNDALVAQLEPSARICFYGHTHKPAVTLVEEDGAVQRSIGEGVVALDPDRRGRWFINPGSVDAARRPDRRAQLAIYDSDACTVELLRVPYDHDGSERKARCCGYRVGRAGVVRHEIKASIRRGAGKLVAVARRLAPR